MAVYPGVSIRSLRHTFTPAPAAASRRRGLTRRKRAAPGTTARMAADGGCGRRGKTSSNFSGRGTSGGNVSSNRVSSRISSSDISLAEATTATAMAAASGGRGGLGAFSGNVERPPDGARDMQIDGDIDDDDVGDGGGSSGSWGGAGGGSGGGSGGEVDLCHRSNRCFSCPADKREARPRPNLDGKGLGLGFRPGLGLGRVAVSSARGITMDTVFGTVRAKTSPAASITTATAVAAAAAPAPALDSTLRRPKSAGSLRSMVELSAAVNEASEEKSTAGVESSPERPAVVEMTMELRGVEAGVEDRGGEGGEEVERVYRATSTAGLLFTGGVGGSQGPTKRAKSGATSVGARMVLAAGRIQEPDRVAAAAVHAAPPGAGAVTAAAATAEAATAARMSTPCAMESEGEGGEAAAVSVAEEAPWTNEAWLAVLAPLLRTAPAGTHPEDFLHDILRERGYSVEMVSMKETEFHRVPEAARVSAYDKTILSAVLEEDEAALERMRAAGRRMDACNRFGDSVLHMACRRGRAGALRYLLRVCGRGGVVLSDDFGRTLMHDACWTATPRFDVASAVLDADPRLLRMLDSRGSSPLQYVPQDQWPLWCAFFESRKEVYWPSLAPGQVDAAGVIPRSRSSVRVGSGDATGVDGVAVAGKIA